MTQPEYQAAARFVRAAEMLWIDCEACGELLVHGDDPEYMGMTCKHCGHIQVGMVVLFPNPRTYASVLTDQERAELAR